VNHNKTIIPITRLNQAKYLFSLFISGYRTTKRTPKARVITTESWPVNVSKTKLSLLGYIYICYLSTPFPKNLLIYLINCGKFIGKLQKLTLFNVISLVVKNLI